jgi:hypothetical protein
MRTIKESEELFLRDFYNHSGWDSVLEHLEKVAVEFKLQVADATPETFLYRQGQYKGFYEAIAAIRTLLKQGG